MWSQRNNNNYQQTGLLTALSYYASNNRLFLRNFYLKAKRSVLKPKNEGPAAYVLAGDEARPGAQAALLRVLQKQRCEISRATAPFTVTMPARKPKPRAGDEGQAGAPEPEAKGKAPKVEERQFPAGSYVVRMDQPYSRIADALLDYQVPGARTTRRRTRTTTPGGHSASCSTCRWRASPTRRCSTRRW